MERKPISPQFASFADKLGLAMPWIGLLIGLGLVGVAIWGFPASRSLARPYVSPGSGMTSVVQLGIWLVMFFPIALCGAYLARSVLRQMRITAAESRIRVRAEASVVILPPPSVYTGPSPTGHAVPSHTPSHSYVPPPGPEPMDDLTTRRLNEISDRAATVFNVAAGLFLVISGLVGFWVIASDLRKPWGYRVAGLETRMLLGFGFLTFIGAMLLIRGFRTPVPDTAWLAPLQAFTRIVFMRAASERAARKNQERPRLGPG